MYETIMTIDQQTFGGSSWSPRNTLQTETVETAETEAEVESWLWDWYFADTVTSRRMTSLCWKR